MCEPQHGARCPRLTGHIDRCRTDRCVDLCLKKFPRVVCLFLTSSNRRMPLSVGHSSVRRDERGRNPGHHGCRRASSHRHFDGTGLWTPIVFDPSDSPFCLAFNATHTQPYYQVNDAAPSGKCVYPKYSTPACVNGSPCGFVCADGFTPFPADKPKECRCKGEHVEVCNDKCVAKGACPTHRMQHDYDDRRRWLSSSSCAEKGHGWSACGVYGGGPRAWECVNSERDLESCESFFLLVSLGLSGQVPA